MRPEEKRHHKIKHGEIRRWKKKRECKMRGEKAR